MSDDKQSRVVIVRVNGEEYPVDLDLLTYDVSVTVSQMVDRGDNEAIIRFFQSLMVRMFGMERIITLPMQDFNTLTQKVGKVIQMGISGSFKDYPE